MGDAKRNRNHDFDFMKNGEPGAATVDFHDYLMVPADALVMVRLHFTVTGAGDKTTTKKWILHFEK